MSAVMKKFLISLAVGLVLSLVLACIFGIFKAESSADVLRILSDGFFVAAAGYLVTGGITFTVNGGAMDGLGFAAKTGMARIKRDFEESKVSFAQYREERQRKAKSPAATLLAGAVLLVIAIALVTMYSNAMLS